MATLITLHSFKTDHYDRSLLQYLRENKINYNCSPPELFIAIMVYALTDICNLEVSNKLYGISYVTDARGRALIKQWVSDTFIPVEYRRLRNSLRHVDYIEDIEYRGGSLYAIKASL